MLQGLCRGCSVWKMELIGAFGKLRKNSQHMLNERTLPRSNSPGIMHEGGRHFGLMVTRGRGRSITGGDTYLCI